MAVVILEARKPKDINDNEMAAILALIAGGNEVANGTLAEGLARAHLIITAKDAGQVIGIAAVKSPHKKYIKRIRKLSGFRPLSKIKYEFGYDVVDPAYREKGIYSEMRALRYASVNEPVFATVRVAKSNTINQMTANGWMRVGRTWPGRQGDVCLMCRSLVVRPFRKVVADFILGLTQPLRR